MITRNMFDDEQKELLNERIIATVSVVSPSGLPHVTPVWIIEHEGKLYFNTPGTNVKSRYLQKNVNIAVNILSAGGLKSFTVSGKGMVKKKEILENYETIVRKIAKKYNDAEKIDQMVQHMLKPHERILVEITPEKLTNVDLTRRR